MAALLQTVLVCMGAMGLLLAIPAAIITWSRHGGFHEAALKDLFTLISPLICGIAIAAGVGWSRLTKKKESRRSPGQMTEDSSGGDSGGDGGGSD